jgi:hypothetical protein
MTGLEQIRIMERTADPAAAAAAAADWYTFSITFQLLL